MTLHLILQIVALILLLCAALNVPSSRIGLGWAGLAMWLLSELVTSGAVVFR
jgi:hypothetical protein